MDFSRYAKEGIDIWLNNRPIEAEAHLKDLQKDVNNIQIQAGYAFIICMNGIISYEIDKIEEAQALLIQLEKQCATDTDWFKSIRSKIFSKCYSNEEIIKYMAFLEEQIILADTQLCLGILTILMQDFKGIMKGSWLLRKAWKIYQKTYANIYEIYKSILEEGGAAKDENDFIYQLSPSSNYSLSSTSFENCENPDMNRSKSASSISNYFHTKYNALFGINNSVSTTNKPARPSTSSSVSSNDNTVINKTKLTKSNTINFSETNSNNNNSRNTKNNNVNLNQMYPKYNDPSRKFLKFNIKNIDLIQKHVSNDMQLFNDNALSSSNNLLFIDIKRLMGAVSFGYGLFQLAISLLPPNVFRIISFFGFEGDRNIGVSCLKKARESDDMRAPFATLALLWYITMGLQIFGLEEGTTMDDSLLVAEKILVESEDEYGNSALFLFFKGRQKRINGNLMDAIESFESAYSVSTQNEIKLLCLHEIGWCRLIELNFSRAVGHFYELGMNSRFSKSFYVYVTLILQGAAGNHKNVIVLRRDVVNIISRSCHKDTQIEKFILRRVIKVPENVKHEGDCGGNAFNTIYWRLLIYEMLYLWNSISSCSPEAIDQIISDCSNDNNIRAHEPMIGLSKLILGYCEARKRNVTAAIQAFSDCLAARRCEPADQDGDIHVSAYCNYELAMTYIKSKKETHALEAKQLLLHIKQCFKNYDFENRLSLRIHQALSDCF